MFQPRFVCFLLAILFTSGASLPAAIQTEDEAGREGEARKLVESLHYQQGVISLKSGLAKLSVPEQFRFLDAAGAQTVLSKIWGNPTDNDILGLLVPANFTPLAPNAWAVVISYEEEGYVKDNDAAKIDYADLLKKMQTDSVEGNKEREKAGFPAVEIVGWAKPPRYDGATHKLYWAKELKFGDSAENTLNYNIRMLGRRGVLVLNAVAGMDRLEEIDQATPAILQMVDFQEGHRYTDFNPSTDKVATYGLAALIAGGVLAKAGFFKLLIPALLAAKKFVVLAVVAVVGFVKKLFGGRRERI